MTPRLHGSLINADSDGPSCESFEANFLALLDPNGQPKPCSIVLIYLASVLSCGLMIFLRTVQEMKQTQHQCPVAPMRMDSGKASRVALQGSPQGPPLRQAAVSHSPALLQRAPWLLEGRGHEKASPDERNEATQTSSFLSRTHPSVLEFCLSG